MKYKICVLYILLLVILTSCNTQVDVATAVSTPIPIETPAPPTQTSTPTETLIPTPTVLAAIEAEVVEYDVVKDPYKFRDCVIEVDANAENPVGSIIEYVKSLKKFHGKDRVYDPSKLRLDRMLVDYGGEIFYDGRDDVRQAFKDPEARPFERGAFCLTKFTGSDGTVLEYFTSFVQYYQAGLTPEEYPWLVLVTYTKPGVDDAVVRAYMESMNFPNMITDNVSQGGAIIGIDPLTDQLTYQEFDDMDFRFEAARNGDMTKLDGDLGVVIQNRIRKTDATVYK